MSASGSLETLRLAELLQVAALFKKMGSIRLQFPGQRVITVYLNDGALSGLSDSGRVWQLGDLLASMGRIDAIDKQRLLTESTTRGKRLGQLLVDQHYITKSEMEQVLRRLILQSLLFAVENESTGMFEMHLGAVSQTTMMFPITDFLMELTSAVDEFERLRRILGPDGSLLRVAAAGDETDTLRGLSYRTVQVLAHVDGHKSPMDVAAVSPLSPTETLNILCDLARSGVIGWVGCLPERALEPSGARVVHFVVSNRAQEGGAIQTSGTPERAAGRELRAPHAVW